MKINRAYKFRLYPNNVQQELINKDGVTFEVVNPRSSRELLKTIQEVEDILN